MSSDTRNQGACRPAEDEEVTGEFPVDPSTSGATPTQPKRDRCTLTMLAGPTMGAIYTMDGDELVFGRGSEATARIDDRGLSRAHARLLRRSDGFYLEDLGSTNGTFINAYQAGPPQKLEEGDRIQMGRSTVLRFQLNDAFEQEATRQLYESAVRDGLTEIHNRRYLDERLNAEFAYARRHGEPLSVLLVDIDHFKRLNDNCGHHAGDAVLRVVAATMKRILRAEDVLARYGGEEFCVVTRGIDARNAAIVAERLRRTIEQMTIPWEGQRLRVTVSCGAATFGPNRWFTDSQTLLAAADQALYRAKDAGRNCCRQ